MGWGLAVVAIKDIKKNTELLSDYGTNYDYESNSEIKNETS